MKELIVTFIGIAVVTGLCALYFSGDSNSVKSNTSSLMRGTTQQIEEMVDD